MCCHLDLRSGIGVGACYSCKLDYFKTDCLRAKVAGKRCVNAKLIAFTMALVESLENF